MTTVIGLFQNDKQVQDSIHRLSDFGFAADKIRVLTGYNDVQRLFGCNESHIVAKYVGWGALLGVAISNLLGLTFGVFVCINLLGYISGMHLICSTAYFTVVGLILGTSAGLFIGVSTFEKCTNLYTDGICSGGKLMTVKVDNELITDEVINVLHQENAAGVKTIEVSPDISPDWQAATANQ